MPVPFPQDRTAQAPAGSPHGRSCAAPGEPPPGPRVGGAVSLRSNFAWTLAGNLTYAGCQWAMLVVLARLADEAVVGRFAYGFAVTAPVFLLGGLQVRQLQITDATRGFAFPDYLGLSLGGMAAALLVTLGIVLVGAHDRETRLTVLAVGACKAIEGITDVYYGGLHKHERMRPIAVSLIWRGALGLLALGAVLLLGGGLLLAIAALGVVWLAVLGVHTLPAATALLRATGEPGTFPRLRWGTARQIAATSAPLAVVNMLVSLRGNVPRYFVERRGAHELGVFAALSSLVVVGTLVVGALGQAATPRLARYHAEGRVSSFRRLIALLLLVAGLLGGAGLLVALVAGRPILLLLFGPEYAERADVLDWLMATACISYASSFLGFGLTAARRFRVQVPLFAFTALACAAACHNLVPGYGLKGAAWAAGIAFLVELVAMAMILRMAIREPGARE